MFFKINFVLLSRKRHLPRFKNADNGNDNEIAHDEKEYHVEKVLCGGRCTQNSGRYFFLIQWQNFNEKYV